MRTVGIDLHQRSMTVCVREADGTAAFQELACRDERAVRRYFERLVPFRAAVEATRGVAWLADLLAGLAVPVVAVAPKQLRALADHRVKTDRRDAALLAHRLAAELLPEAYLPGPRGREHRLLVRHRDRCRKQAAAAKARVRGLLAARNRDRPVPKTAAGRESLVVLPDWSGEERFILRQTLRELTDAEARKDAADARLQQFAADAPADEMAARAALRRVPGFGPVVVEVVLAEVADPARFRTGKLLAAYAGVVPECRSSGGVTRHGGITRRGSGLLRWALVQAAKGAIRCDTPLRHLYDRVKGRGGPKKATVAVANKLARVTLAVWRQAVPGGTDLTRQS